MQYFLKLRQQQIWLTALPRIQQVGISHRHSDPQRDRRNADGICSRAFARRSLSTSW
jgi:hypothetical protein